ncbi:MAG: beta-propeller fold lactonase family protein, partial [Myxococcota bacterium]|nr:beta-propeller fold lactonase family protein [Myxococcota bacterium]
MVGPQGDAWVSLRHGGSVVRIAADTNTVDLEVEVGTEPYGLALSPDGSRLYVTIAGEDQLVVLDAVTGEEVDKAATLAHPRSVVFSDRQVVVVAHLDAGAREFPIDDDGTVASFNLNFAYRVGNPWQAVNDHSTMIVSELDFETGVQSHFAGRGVAITTDPEHGDVYLAHNQVAPGTPERLIVAAVQAGFELLVDDPDSPHHDGKTSNGGTPNGGGYGSGSVTDFNTPFRPVEPSITRIRSKETWGTTDGTTTVMAPVGDNEARVLAHRLDQPMDLHHHPKRSLLFMVGQGTDNVLVFNSAVGDPMTSPVAEIAVGEGPKAIVFSDDGHTAYVLNAHEYTVGAVDLTALTALGADVTTGCGAELDVMESTLT